MLDINRLSRSIVQALEKEGLQRISVVARDDSIHVDAFVPRYSHDVDPENWGFDKAEVTVRLK